MKVTHVIFDGDEPVDEPTARARAITEVLGAELSGYLDRQDDLRKYSVAAVAGGVVLTVLGLVGNLGGIAVLPLFLGLAGGGAGYWYAENESAPVQVNGVTKGQWTGYAIPDQDGVVVYDALDSIDATTFNLELLEDDSAIRDSKHTIEELGEFPVVMESDEPLEETFTESLETIQQELDSAEETVVEAPIVSSDDPSTDAIEFFVDQGAPGDERAPRTVNVTPGEAAEDVSALQTLEEMAEESDDEESLEGLSEASRQLVSDLSGVQETAIDLLNDHVFAVGDAFGLVSYNFYCPDCLLDDIESTVELTDPQAGEWYCETCRNHFETADLVPRHKIKDDVVNPVWDQLWAEKDDQRREIYENIEDQKTDLQEREFEQRREEIRSATDRIKELRSKIRDLQTQAKAAEGKVEEIGDLMVKYDRLNEERKEQFQQDVEDFFSEIDEETEQILEETRQEEQRRIQRAQEEAKEKAQIVREEERRREIEKFVAEQQRADQRMQANIARSDQRMQANMDHREELHDEEIALEKKHHREDVMLDTEGQFYGFDLHNKWEMLKKHIPAVGGATKHEG